jgi:hypothetical protein
MRKYLPLVFGVPGCLAAGWFELTRALGGREVAWVYAFEWPLYAVIGVYMWWHIWHKVSDLPSAVPAATLPKQAGPPPDDPELAAWESYLANLHAVDPPGGPPPRG